MNCCNDQSGRGRVRLIHTLPHIRKPRMCVAAGSCREGKGFYAVSSETSTDKSIENKILQAAARRHWSRYRQASNILGGQLFHYTTVAGLQGIIENNCLHASAAYFLNDSSEIEYGIRVC